MVSLATKPSLIRSAASCAREATTDLDVRVSVNRGIVRLRGSVPSLDDAENVEEVAFRVEGVVDVMDELVIEDLA